MAAPYGKEIFSNLLNYLNIAPTNLEQDEKKLEKNIKMPDLIGMGLTEAVQKIIKLRLSYEIDGEGSRIVNQLPPAGTMLYSDATVILITD